MLLHFQIAFPAEDDFSKDSLNDAPKSMGAIWRKEE